MLVGCFVTQVGRNEEPYRVEPYDKFKAVDGTGVATSTSK